ncbi:hypothetical protein [Ramlibacter alkalitolerans]|uniref:Ribbon-helix-helix protein CopG domain-containing protein n=1 Tax=Ramlibacter alkalitolerans TaxID=2039631 RepID=A0ABS1JUA4_9BURK|nr:hypothetical protein [Ramlibacter alkalitolerans]MBL0427787.1 hypothetical protein [Ramlibacter alkalitolerans]
MCETVIDEKKRHVFRLSRQTLKALAQYCSAGDVTKSDVLRHAITYFNESSQAVEKAKTWKLLCPRGADTISMWTDPEMIQVAKARADSHNISLNHYVELAVRSSLGAT